MAAGTYTESIDFGGHNIRLIGTDGPSATIIDAQNSGTVVTIDDGETSTVDLKDQTKSVEFGVGFGGGVRVPMGNYQVFVEARYALGLTKVNDPADETDPLSEVDIKTKGIQVFAGFVIPVGASSV